MCMFSWNDIAEDFEGPPGPDASLDAALGEGGKSIMGVDVEVFEVCEVVDMMLFR